ncbi:MAG: hypothetical protein WB816_19650 [Methylocystis sp.]
MRLFLASLALLAFLGAGAYVLLRADADSSAARIEANIADARFVFDPALARDEATAAGGFVDRLAFVVAFPDFASPPRAEKAPSPERLAERARGNVLITVSLKDDGVDPADRPMRLYARFLEAETVAGPGGLVMRRFEQGSPYDLEQLYVAPPDGRDFFARCPKPASNGDGPGEMCLSLFRVDGLDVELRFAPELLENWEVLNEGARAFVARIRAGDAGKNR